MARTPKPERLADDGEFKTDGMYRSGGPTAEYDAEEARRAWNGLITDFHTSAMERVKAIRAWLSKAIAPFLDGPHDPQAVVRGEITRDTEGWFEHLTLDGKTGLYFITADRHTWIEDCADALRENRQLEELLAGGSDVDSIVRLAFRQGALVQRIQDRAIFAHLVLSETGRRAGARKTAVGILNADHAELHPQYQPEVDRLMQAGVRYSRACEEVADSFGVATRTVERHTTNPRPRKRKQK